MEKEAMVHVGGARGWASVVGALCLVEQLIAPQGGLGTNHKSGVMQFVGRCWICQAPTGSPTPIRWPTLSMWYGWPTAALTWCAAGSRTRHWDTEDEKVILFIGSGAC